MRTGEGMTKKMNRRSIAYIVSVVAILLVIAAVLTVFFTVHRHEKLLDRRDKAIAELTARRGEYDESRIVLADTSEDKAKALADRLGAHLRITKDGRFAVLSLPEGTTIIDVYAADENLGELSSMSADYRVNISELSEEEADTGRIPVRPQYTVSDSAYNLQTYLDYLNLKNVWNYTRASGITVAIIDTGIDTDHPEFAGRISEYSYNATEDKIVKDYTGVDGGYDWSLIEDEQGHGTAVAGVVGASMNSGAIVGVAPEVTLLVIKAECDESGAFKRTSDLVFGLYYAIERDVNVVNMSFGINGNNPFAAATQLAVDSDIICVAAAGNDATASLTYPAADPNVFGVGALEADGWNLASYSNYGENVNFVAPGTVYTTKMGGGYGSMNGTSFASPITAGVMALYLSQNRYSEFITVREILYDSCYDLGDLGCDWYYGYGALDVSAFILEERGTVTFNMLTDELENTKQTFIRSHTLQSIPEPERLYAIFDGWYYDPQCTDEYNLYSDKFVSDLTLYANWVNEEDGIPYTYVELPDGTIEIRSYTGHRRYLTIPDYIDGKVVSSIGVGAFEGETRIREINLPKYLVRIRDNAFAGCNNLLNIKIPDTVTEISVKAFYDDVRLSYVAFGEGSALTKIEPYAFGGCSKLTRFELPASLTDVNGTAFFGTTSMTAFTVAKGSKTFTARDGVLMNIGEDTVICYPAGLYGEYKVPDSVSMIGVCAFACSKITQIDLNRTEYIGSSAFMYSSLESLIIPDGVKLLGDKAFASCYRLRAVKLGAGLTNISNEVFAGCSALPEIEIPANIVSIGGGAFFGTDSMEKVTFAEDGRLSEIAFEAFAGSGLVSVEIPASVTELGGGAFSGCSALSAVTFGEGSSLTRIEASTFSGDSRLSSVTLPESIVYIGRGAFAGDISLTEITLTSGLVYLGDFAFESTGLVTVAIPKTVETFGIGAFASCHSLTDINVDAENAKYIDIDGVVYDRAMTTLIEYPAGNARTSYALADGIVTVGQYAFCGSWNLQRVTLSQTVETVDEYAFYDCRSITSYTLSDVLTYIKRYAFAMNSSLRSMAMPDSLMQISNYAFMQDWSLSSVTFTENSRLPRISFGAFAYCGLQSFRVPASVSTMAQGAFMGCSNLYSFTFAAGSRLESISAYMFDGCTNLRTVTFESGSALTSIQAHGFDGMRNLTSVDFGDAKVTNIDNFAFRFCESLKNFTIPDGVTFLGRYAFYYCTALESVTVPASMDFIGRYAFLGTNKISIYFAAEKLPPYLAEDWDHGITGYYLGVTDVVTDGDWKYAKLTDGGIAILGYSGTDINIDLTALDFGGNIVNIGGSAFEYSAVESIRLPETLITIQARAFYHSALKSINIPAVTEFIGREAFSDTPIETLTFADGAKLTVIERSAFENTKHLGSVIIPASLKQMGRAAFKNSGIMSLAFADGFSLAEIPEEAFAYTAITAVRIPDSVTLINHGAFRNTADLETVIFGAGENLTLGSNAFYSSGLKTLEIPANMTYIGEYAFVGLGELGEFKVAESNPYYKAVDGLLVSKSGRKLIAVPAGRDGSLTLPVGIEVIGFGAFESSKLSQILFIDNANILSFGYRAFFGMKNIREISIPASVVAIDYYAFANCTALEKVTFAEENLLRGVYEGAFYGCKSLCEILLPDSVVEISDFAFYGCRRLTALPVSDTGTLKGIYSYGMAYTGLTELNLPETVVDIDSYAFKGTRLKSVTIPDANAKQLIIGIGAFEDCNELEEITLPFIGAEFEDDKLTWLGYIFGAGSYEANSTYVPESLKKVTISEGITSIGAYAFYQLTSIEEISVPHSVTTIYWEAFRDTTARYELTNTITTVSVYVGDTVMYEGFGNGHFGEGLIGHLELSDKVTSISCTGITSITIPDSVTRIALSSSNLTSITIPNSVTSLRLSGCSGLKRVTIPDSVTNIGYGAFRDCTSLTSITIPDSVTSIDREAFERCTSLTNVTIGNGVTSIGDWAFWCCSSLRSVAIGNGVTSIGNGAFSDCHSLTSITIPNSVTSICNSAFFSCNSLYVVYNNSDLNFEFESSDNGYIARYAKLIVDKNGSKRYRSENSDFEYIDTTDGFRFTKENDEYKLIAYFGNEDTVILPKDVNRNSYTIYQMRGVCNVIIPDGITSIDSYAFYGCSSLTSIVIPDSVTSIGDWAFNGCGSLTSITIPDSVTSIDSYAFYGCSSLRSVAIGNGVTSIGNGAFSDCHSLTSITIPNSVTSIGDYAFNCCSSLMSAIIGSNLKNLGAYAFRGCPISEMEISEQNENFKFINGVLYDKHVTSIKCVPNGIISIEIPATVMDISGAFNGNTTIQIVYFEEESKLTSIEDEAFAYCRNLASITIPDSVTNIGVEAFLECTSLTSITIPDSVTNIGYYAFLGCWSLTNINVSANNLNYCSAYGILYDKAKRNIIHVPQAISSGISIPDSVTSIDNGAFSGCSSLKSISVSENNPNYSSVDGVLYDKAKTKIIHVPQAISSGITIPGSVTSIGSATFNGCSNLMSVTIENGVTNIGYGAFGGCDSLTSVTIPDSVASIGDYAFSDCTNLVSVTMGNGVTSIGYRAFYRCDSLTGITIPDSVTSIGSYAFSGCSSLTSITIQNSATSIGNDAFYGCSSLYVIYNNSDLNFEFESSDNGYIARYAKLIVDKNGSKRYRDEDSDFEYIDTADGFRFMKENGEYKLIAYLGNEDTVILPKDINGNSYAIYLMRGVRNVIIPDGMTSIEDSAFSRSLTSITIPDSVVYIGNRAFWGCNNLASITISDSVMRIGSEAFSGTAYYNNKDNWDNGALYIGKHLIKVNNDVKEFVVRPETLCIAYDAFSGCYKLKKLTIGGDHSYVLRYLTNLETLVLTELPTHYIYHYFDVHLPITLKNIVLTDSVRMRSDAFYGITGVTIYVAANEKDVRWNENFPGWNNGNKVVYGDKWITADFYDKDGNIISSDILLTSQIVRQPYVASMMDDTYYYEFLGWDIDGDGIDDVVPATSSSNISARAVFSKEHKCAAAGHTYGDWSSDATNHWLECSVCHEKKDITAHIFDNACDTTCDTCGYVRIITHSYEQKYDDTNHWDECSVCHDKKDIIAHIFDNACDTTCDTCGYVRSITHSYEQKYDDNSHWDECSVCHDKKDITAHIFDNACDTACDACGYTRVITHSYEQKCDENSHWDECSVCHDKKDITAHIFDNACDTACDACGYTRVITHSYEQNHDENSHWDECSVCHDKKNVTAHIFDNACDATCDTCGYTRVITHSYEQKHDENSHWDECSVCHDKKNVTAHVFDNSCDTTCDTCGYVRSITHSYEQRHDEDSHWEECSVCHERKEIASHIFDNACDTTCDACGYTRSITHSYEQKHDENNHWDECTVCGDKQNVTAHIFDNSCDTTCDTCGYTRSITHSYEQKHDELNHWDECKVCGDKQNIETHTNTKNKHICDTCGRKLSDHEGGTATCSEKAICTICGEKYGDFAEHGFGEWKANAEGKRTKVCSACGKVANFMYGDLNYDGKVNAIDLTILRRYLARYSSDIDISVADFNGDGKVNTLDLMLLRRFLVGYDSVLGK